MLRAWQFSALVVHALAKVNVVLIQKIHMDDDKLLQCWVFHEGPIVPVEWKAAVAAAQSIIGAENNIHPVAEAPCDDAELFQFLISDDQISTIRPVSRPDLCAEAPETTVRPSFLRFKRCSGSANQSFMVPRSNSFPRRSEFKQGQTHVTKANHICTAANADFCAGEFQTYESCFKHGQISEMNCFTGIVGISDETSFNASSVVRNVQFPWLIINPNIWPLSRGTEAAIFRVMVWYLVCCATGYVIYVLCIFRRFICMGRSLGALTSRLWEILVEAASISNRTYRSLCASCGIGSSSDDLTRLMERRRLQRAQIYSQKISHALSIYAIFKAHQFWQSDVGSNLCSDFVRACDASTASMHIYNYEIVPLLTMVYPALVVVALLGEKNRPWLCDTLLGILYVGWSFYSIMDSPETGSFTEGKILFCRICQIVVLGNPRLAAVCELLAFIFGRAYSYSLCSRHQQAYLSSDAWAKGCLGKQNFLSWFLGVDTEKSAELGLMLIAAGCVHVFDFVQAREIAARRRGEAREVTVRLLKSHLDVLYDCVIYLGESYKITTGAPKIASLLRRGPINEHSFKDRYLFELMAEEDRHRFDEHMKNVCLFDTVNVLHVSLIDNDGGVVPCELFTSSAADDEGTRTYVVGVKEVEREIEASLGARDRATIGHPPTSRVLCHEEEHYIGASSDRPSESEGHECGNINESLSKSYASQSETSREEMSFGLSADWGQQQGTTFVDCTEALEMALGKIIHETPVRNELIDPSVFDEWLQISLVLWQQDLNTKPLKVYFNSNNWRPVLSAMLHIEDIGPVVGESRRIAMRVRKLRCEIKKFKHDHQYLPRQRPRRVPNRNISS